MKFSKFEMFIVNILVFLFVLSSVSYAIPAFARRYRISCSTCHAPIPKLKPFGDEFAGNGMIIPEEEKDRDYVSSGDDLLWLNRTFPLGVRFDAYSVYDSDSDATDVTTDLQSPWGLKLLSGGTLYKNIGYYFYFYMSERGEVAGVEDAYIHFNDIGGTALDIMVGQFQTSDPLMKRELRLTFEDYMAYKTKIGGSKTTLTYDRGLMFVYGIEKTGTDLVAMVVNGNGKREADDEHKFDQDKYKNYGFRLNQGIGEHFSVGGFYYMGKEREIGSNRNNEVTYYGPDASVSVGPIEVTGQYLIRNDSNPWFMAPSDDIETKGIIVETVISPQLDRSKIYFVGLYNMVDSEDDDYDYESATVNANYLLARNLKMIVEYTRDLVHDSDRFTIGLVSGF